MMQRFETFAKRPLLPDYCVKLKFRHGVTRSEALALTFSAILEIFNIFLRLHEVKHQRSIFAFLVLEQN